MLGPLIAAGISAASSIFGSKKQADAAEENNAKNIQLQKDFAQQGIQWKVNDAKAAGIHPLFALGANTHSFAPVNAGDTSGGAGIAAAGQDISRAINAVSSAPQKTNAIGQAVATLQVENASLQNEMLRTQIMRLKQENQPSMQTPDTRYGIPGQAPTVELPGTLVQSGPLKRVTSDPNAPHNEPGAIADTGWARTATGWAPVPGKDVKERIEDMIIPELAWGVRNYAPGVTGKFNPPFPAPQGQQWTYTGLEYRLVPIGQRSWRDLLPQTKTIPYGRR